jgi:hypothetical protein
MPRRPTTSQPLQTRPEKHLSNRSPAPRVLGSSGPRNHVLGGLPLPIARSKTLRPLHRLTLDWAHNPHFTPNSPSPPAGNYR